MIAQRQPKQTARAIVVPTRPVWTDIKRRKSVVRALIITPSHRCIREHAIGVAGVGHEFGNLDAFGFASAAGDAWPPEPPSPLQEVFGFSTALR